MYRFFLTFILCTMFCGLRANELAVTAKIIGTGIDSRGNQICRVQAEVKNVSGREITIAMMTCGWDDSWVVMPETVFSIPIIPCDSNFPSSYSFPLGGGYVFRFQISALASAAKIEGIKVKVGFRFIRVTPEQIKERSIFDLYDEHRKEAPVVWSEEMILPRI
ncbi:MAG: hypothetical protein JSS11_17525, partial [Verrucomicrobia bacterium]|nr:hypothetical protein [Verrucomicrobiota bacterium]